MEGTLYVEVNKVFEEMHCSLEERIFTAYRRRRVNEYQTNELAIQFEIKALQSDAKTVKLSLADLSRVMKTSKMGSTPYFFNVFVSNKIYSFAAMSDEDRANWIQCIKELNRASGEEKQDQWIKTGFLEKSFPAEHGNKFKLPNSPINYNVPNKKQAVDLPNEETASGHGEEKEDATAHSSKQNTNTSTFTYSNNQNLNKINRILSNEDNDDDDDDDDDEDDRKRANQQRSKYTAMKNMINAGSTASNPANQDNNNNNQEAGSFSERLWEMMVSCYYRMKQGCCCRMKETICYIKVDTIARLVKVCLAFPFIIVVASLNLSSKHQFLRSTIGMRIFNILIYVAPVVYVRFVLSQYNSPEVQRLAIGFYLLIYLMPVIYVVFTKVKVSSSTSKIEEGTFCFKPARRVRVTQANFYAIFGFVMEWIQHCCYVLPVGIVTSKEQKKLSDFPPYLSFNVYFWICVSSTFICGLIIILNSVLRGKIHYRFQNSSLVWFFLYNVGSPMFVTIVTILLMSLWCDYDTADNNPVLYQQPSIACYSDEHITMSRAALIAVAIYMIQHTLLPSGTFKETMRDDDLDIMFVPVYLQAHYLLKAIFCGVYVYFYQDNFPRVLTLTIINMLLLILNNFMKPCSVSWINLLRDGFFIHASMSGIISLNYLGFEEDGEEGDALKGMVISTLASLVVFSAIGLYTYYHYTARSTEYSIAAAFLDLEWQVSRGGSVHPRVLEPLISLTLSPNSEDTDIAKKYIGQLVWLISYPNMRVQFQSAWGLANLALVDEDARIKIHKQGGTKTLFEWYLELDHVVQLEALAALVNLTLSYEVTNDMIGAHQCIPFFLGLLSSNKLKHAQFSAIAIANIARKEEHRELLRRNNGIPLLVSCIMSADYSKRRHGCRALANMALSSSKEVEQIFESKGLIDRIIKMMKRKEIETQREVVALARNLVCHSKLRPLLLDRGIMEAVEICKLSVFEDVRNWCDEITLLLQREISSGAADLKSLMRREQSQGGAGGGASGGVISSADIDLLKRMEVLHGRVEWSTWGSKLENIFAAVFSTIPTLTGATVTTTIDTAVNISLPNGLRKKDLKRWRDTLSYHVIERPAHGKLSEYTTVNDSIVYTPVRGYVGADFFTYRMTVNNLTTAPVTVAIQVFERPTLYGNQQSMHASTNASINSNAGNAPATQTSAASPTPRSNARSSNNNNNNDEQSSTSTLSKLRGLRGKATNSQGKVDGQDANDNHTANTSNNHSAELDLEMVYNKNSNGDINYSNVASSNTPPGSYTGRKTPSKPSRLNNSNNSANTKNYAL